MTQRGYRRVSHGMFLLLFVVFFLLYLLLRDNGPALQTGSGDGDHRITDMGIVEISDVKSSGFILDRLQFTRTTSLASGTQFDDAAVPFRADIYNEAQVPVRVQMRISGTNISDDTITNAGLHCFGYYFSGDTDPFPDGYQAYLQKTKLETRMTENGLSLTTDPVQCPRDFVLGAGETLHLMLVFWLDYDELLLQQPGLISQVGKLESEIINGDFSKQYNVTVKLTSRAADLG